MNLDFKYFIRRLVYFIPLFFLLSVPVAILVFSGEFLSLDQIIKKQTEHSSLVGIAYSEINPHYKFLRTTKLQPTILSLGTSRVMQFRDYNLFKRPLAGKPIFGMR